MPLRGGCCLVRGEARRKASVASVFRCVEKLNQVDWKMGFDSLLSIYWAADGFFF